MSANPDADPRELDPDTALSRKIEAGSHSGVAVLRRRPDEKGKLASVIDVTSVRRLNEFFGMTAGEGGARVVVVDSVDEMNRNAANALLKSLEEPPANCTFLLVCHQRHRILQTILSRCAALRFSALSAEEVASAIHSENDEEKRNAALYSGGRIGRAMEILELGVGPQLDAIEKILLTGQSPDLQTLRTIAEALTGKDSDAARALFLDVLTERLSGRAITTVGVAQLDWIRIYDHVTERVARMHEQHLDPVASLLDLFWSLQKQVRGLSNAH